MASHADTYPMTTLDKPKHRALSSYSVLHEGMRIALVEAYHDGRSKVVHVGTVRQVFGDGAHIEYDYEPGKLHLHYSIDMTELLEGNPLRNIQSAPIDPKAS